MTTDTQVRKFWIAMAVDVVDHPVVGLHVKGPNAVDPKRALWTPFDAWFWMLTEASYADRKQRVGTYIVFLRRGQMAVSYRHFARETNWSFKAIRLFLARLKKHKMIEMSAESDRDQLALDLPDRGGQKSGRGTGISVITICNYGNYQSTRRARGTAGAQQGHTGGTAGAQDHTSNIGTTDPVTSSNQSPVGHTQTEDQSIRSRGTDQTDEGQSNVIPLRKSGMVMDAPTTERYVIPSATLRKIETLGCDPEELLDRMNEQIDKYNQTGKGRPIGSRSRYLIQSAINEAHERTGASKETLKALISGNEFARQHAMQQIADVDLKSRLSDEQRAHLQRANATVSNRSALAAALKR